MNSDPSRVRISFGGPLTPVVRTLIWINALAFVFLLLAERQAMILTTALGEGISVPYPRMIVSLFGLTPRAVVSDWALWQPVTYLFLHKGFIRRVLKYCALRLHEPESSVY